MSKTKKKLNGSSTSKDQSLRLEKVIGLTTTHRSALCSYKSYIFYSSGCICIKYNIFEKNQTCFYQSSTRPVTCLTITENGRYLAVGERGHQPTVTIWDIETKERLFSVSKHKYGVASVAFSPNGQYLVSVGFKHDKQLIIYEWEKERPIAVLKLSNKVNSISFHSSGRYFITCGDKHLKWWFINSDNNTGEIIDVVGNPASITEDQRNAIFVDVVCGSGFYEKFIYCVTSNGMLCSFNESTRMIDKITRIEAASAYSVAFFQMPINGIETDMIAIGCSDGLIKLFTCDFICITTFPLPNPLSTENDIITYPACYAIHPIVNNTSICLTAIYSDHSLNVWDLSDISHINLYHNELSHRGCIWDIQFVEKSDEVAIPSNTFITCSSDHTIKLWNLENSNEILLSIEIPLVSDSVSTSSPSIISNGSITITSQSKHSVDLSNGLPDYEIPSYSSYDSSTPRAIAVNMSLGHIAVGDRSGTIHIYNLQTKEKVITIPAHSAEILTLHYCPTLYQRSDGLYTIDDENDDEVSKDKPLIMLASAGRDRLIHIYDCINDYSLIDTLDHHSSSITNIRFTLDGTKLISCGGDRTLVISTVNGPSITKLKSIQTPHGTINGIALETTNKFVITSGQDKRMNIWNLNSGKHMRVYKNDLITSELYKCDIDPSGMYVCACAFDKSINLLDFFSGEIITQVTGHGELITGIRFSPDGKSLISISGDGCILIWKISDILVKAMQERLVELYTNAQMKQNKVILKQYQQINTTVSPVKDINSINKNNRWASRVVESGGNYEIFGRKVSIDKRNNLNKFSTLELTSTNITPIKDNNNLINTIEDNDNVIINKFSDDDGDHDDDDSDDGSKLFPNLPVISSPIANISTNKDNNNNDNEYWDDFDVNNEITESVNKVDILEKSASNLENWLETMLKNDGQLDNTVIDNDKIIPIIKTKDDISESTKLDLNKSLSSSFFNGLRKPKENQENIHKENFETPNKLDEMSRKQTANNALEGKRRETAAAVAQMKEKLRVMGILGSSMIKPQSILSPPPPQVPIKDNQLDDNVIDNYHEDNIIYPPPPPTFDDINKSIDIINDNSTNNNNDTKSKELELELKLMADICRESLRDLEIVKEKTINNFKKYISLQSSIDQSITSSNLFHNNDMILSNDFKQSMIIEKENLIDDFKKSIESFNDINILNNNFSLLNISLNRSSTNSNSMTNINMNTLDINNILEKYSDQLIDLVAEKIVKKINK